MEQDAEENPGSGKPEPVRPDVLGQARASSNKCRKPSQWTAERNRQGDAGSEGLPGNQIKATHRSTHDCRQARRHNVARGAVARDTVNVPSG